MCGPMYEEELKFWGVDEKQMEPCCWGKYTQHREAEENLKAFVGPGFEDLRTPSDNFGLGLGSGESLDENSSKWQRLQPKMWAILDEPHSSRLAKGVSYMSCIFITVSIAIFCATTMPSIRQTSSEKNAVMGSIKELDYVEMICSIFFTIEFLMRFISCPSKLRFIRGIMNWIDFVAVVPYFVSLIKHDPKVKMLVVIRILRLFRFIKLSYGLQIMVQTLKASSHELILLLLMLLIPVVMFSSIVYYIEVILQEKESEFSSVPASFWWCLITMTTVGYGDMTPATWPGKVVGGACAICGVLIVALPISVIGNNFNLYYSHAQARLKLPVKQRRLVLGAVGLLSKQELSSRRNKKTKLTGLDYELCTSDELSSSMNSIQLQQRRTRSGARPDQLTDQHEEAIRAAFPVGGMQGIDAVSREDIFSPDEEKEQLLQNKHKSSREGTDDEYHSAAPSLNVTINPASQHGCHSDGGPSSETLTKDCKPTQNDGCLNVSNGLRDTKRKLSWSDSRLSEYRARTSLYSPVSFTDQNTRNVMANGNCNSTETNKDFVPTRERTLSALPDYNRNRRKGLSMAHATSKGDPDFMETKI
ncbi:hypothetical protein QZH41_017622 [Actinostola sp. cb2023]|nr:hypothetical protein QZH41_017622 [Actinostola sp. cb2023]